MTLPRFVPRQVEHSITKAKIDETYERLGREKLAWGPPEHVDEDKGVSEGSQGPQGLPNALGSNRVLVGGSK